MILTIFLDFSLMFISEYLKRREGDSNPRYGYPYDSLANCWFQPLTHLTKTVSVSKNCAAKVVHFFEFQKNIFSDTLQLPISIAYKKNGITLQIDSLT